MKLPPYNSRGYLPPGIYILTIEEVESIFGYNAKRRRLIIGLKQGLAHLKSCGCKRVYLNGSFITEKEVPDDFDACWDDDISDQQFNKLAESFPVLLDLSNGRIAQKMFYNGEFFPASFLADGLNNFLEFFQIDRYGNPKGIIKIDL